MAAARVTTPAKAEVLKANYPVFSPEAILSYHSRLRLKIIRFTSPLLSR